MIERSGPGSDDSDPFEDEHERDDERREHQGVADLLSGDVHARR
ncbi:hypothetical protein BN903_2 [Halorubrum sp. AJ67]|nr:hypothetical protein BN903_2 [Halorubrum sp. AJ67]